ncbi:hypothetical protein LCGC14_2232120 [marine sediment metagenome]|uniref:Calcineurin-like phosphoesterase domain-containing protein n=1 Tax=marine sediment metagenome TaxID=412755 RepID=A0A0F9DVN5_9ZZZZ
MFFIGDVHGIFRSIPERDIEEGYFDIIERLGNQKSIQVGDFGFGFCKKILPIWDINHRFIRGNHDDPAACQVHLNHLGDYGVSEDGIFFVGGGYSIDVDWRKANAYMYPHPIWWEDEEIAEVEFDKIIELYETTKPKIIVSHDCPSEIRNTLIDGNKPFRNRTSDGLLSVMFKVHQPELWVFGHYHESFDSTIGRTHFKCLAELEVFEYSI